jgi:hypothetical protein
MNNRKSSASQGISSSGAWYGKASIAEHPGTVAAASAAGNLARSLQETAPLESKQSLAWQYNASRLEDSRTRLLGYQCGLTYSELGNRYPEMKPATVEIRLHGLFEAFFHGAANRDSRTLSYGWATSARCTKRR